MKTAPAPGSASRELARRIGLWGATAIVVGNVVGSGIFVAPGDVLRALGSVHAALAAWILGGALSLVGALAFAELGAAYPHTGGAYVYLRRAFGDRMAFVFGWAELWVIKPTGAAGIAVVFAQYLHEMLPLVPVRALAVGALVLVYALTSAASPRAVTRSSRSPPSRSSGSRPWRRWVQPPSRRWSSRTSRCRNWPLGARRSCPFYGRTTAGRT